MKATSLGKLNTLQTELQASTVRDFEGGWNLTDSDLNLAPKYARVLDNMERGTDGTLRVRDGTVLFGAITTDVSAIVNVYYFNRYIVVVQYSGRFSLVDENGTVTYLPLHTTGADPWPTGVTFVSFTLQNNDLLIYNGVNKPLVLYGNFSNPLYMKLAYSVDAATLSNINTPIGLYVVAHGQYTVVAGLPNKPSTLSISARNTNGTFLGDPAPNDAIELDLGPRVSLGSATILGLLSYKDKLLVAFESGVLPVNLGIYNETVHVPTDDGFIAEYGSLSHRAMINIGDDVYYCDNTGADMLTKSTFNSALRPSRVSELIDPAIKAAITALTPEQISALVFAVYDMLNKRYMLFIPTIDENGVITETVCYSYTDRQAGKTKAWARLKGWNFSCGCRTSRQNLIFAFNNKLYKLDYEATDTALDFVGDTEINAGAGVPITFDWELPWADFNKRMNTKVSQYIGIDAEGLGTFTLSMYTDKLRYDEDGNDAPLLTMDFIGDVPGGYGTGGYGVTPYGSGRHTGNEQLYEFPAEFHTAKLRISGSTSKPLAIASISVLYRNGAFGR